MIDYLETNRRRFSGISSLLYIDAKLFVPIVFITFLGLITIYSSSSGDIALVIKQFTRIVIGVVVMIFLAQINPDNLKLFAPVLYFTTILLLILVLLFGVGKSADRWLDLYFIRFQPSELMKIFVPLMLATYYADKPLPPRTKYIFIAIAIVIVPVLLIMRQPDLGTALLIAAGGLTVAWLAGVRVKFFAFSGLAFLALLPIAISFLKPYQKSRILTFLNPERDPLGAGYQIIQSKIAIGSGGLFGKGFLQGSQSYLDYLPEKHTDFIFTLFSEEFGFFGSLFILFLYAIIVWRIIKIGNVTRSNFGKLFCYGFGTAFFLSLIHI